MRRIPLAVFVGCVALVLAACGGTERQPGSPLAEDTLAPEPATPATLTTRPLDAARFSGEVPMLGGDAARLGVHPGPGLAHSPTMAWRFNAGEGYSSGVWSSPAVVDGVVYTAGQEADYGADNPPALNSYVYALDATTGGERWRFAVLNEVYSSPAVVDGTVYIGCNDGCVYAIDADTGKAKWVYKTEGEVHSSPAVVDGVVYIGSKDSHLYALDAYTGEVRWQFETAREVLSSPTVADGRVFVGDFYGQVYALDAANGERLWVSLTKYGLAETGAAGENLLYVAASDVLALDVTTGREVWRTKLDISESAWDAPILADGLVYVAGYNDGTEKGAVYAFDAVTGARKWRFETGSDVWARPIAAEGAVYFGSWDLWLYALDALTGEQRWRYPLSEFALTSPTVLGGALFIGVGGNLYCLAENGET